MRQTIFPILLLVACSEYGVNKDQEAVGTVTTTIPPTSGTTADSGIFTFGTATGTGGSGTGGTATGGSGTGGTGTGGTATGGTATGTATGGSGTGGTGTGGTTSTGDLVGGHFDVDTTSYVSAIDNGDTDAHVHEYDDTHLVSGIDAFVFHDGALHEIFEDILPDQRFKLLLVNADLSPGGRVVINDVYAPSNDRTWTDSQDYDDTAISALPVYTLSGVPGTTELRELGLYFDTLAIINRELVPTVTGCVRDNVLGVNGSWRNGALTLQAVAVDANGADAFTTDASMSDGDHPVATSGLLWETTIFWHWSGPCSDDPTWATYVP